jgi:hypothetical protein
MLSLLRNIGQIGQEHGCSVECTTSQIVLTRHLPVDVVEFLWENADTHCAPMDQIHGTQFHAFQTKPSAYNLHWNENICSLAMEMIDFSIDILSLCFFSIAKFSVIVLLNLKHNVMHMCYSIKSA